MDNLKMAAVGTQFSDGTVSLAWATGRVSSEIIAVPPANRSVQLQQAILAGLVVETASAVTAVATASVGHRISVYVQETDPGAVGAGQPWVDTSDDPVLKLRNADDDDWVAGESFGMPEIGFGPATPLEIVDGTIDVTGLRYVLLSGEADDDDELTEMTGGVDGQFIVVEGDPQGHIITIVPQAGNLDLVDQNGGPILLRENFSQVFAVWSENNGLWMIWTSVATPGPTEAGTFWPLTADATALGHTIADLADPTDDQQAATKKYVDDNAGGGDPGPQGAQGDPGADGADGADAPTTALTPGDGIISGGAVTPNPGGMSVGSAAVVGRLGGVQGTFVANGLGVTAADPTFDRIDVVYLISPAAWTAGASDPNPPGFDVSQQDGTPSASPVTPGRGPSGSFVAVGADGGGYFAALFSYRVPAGATDASEFTDFTDLRTMVMPYQPSVSGWPLAADVSAASHRITDLTDPSGDQDAATKAYVDSTAIAIPLGQQDVTDLIDDLAAKVPAPIFNAGSSGALDVPGTLDVVPGDGNRLATFTANAGDTLRIVITEDLSSAGLGFVLSDGSNNDNIVVVADAATAATYDAVVGETGEHWIYVYPGDGGLTGAGTWAVLGTAAVLAGQALLAAEDGGTTTEWGDVATLPIATADVTGLDAALAAATTLPPESVTDDATLSDPVMANKTLLVDSADPVTLTVPLDATYGWPLGTILAAARMGAGTVTIEPEGGVTVSSRDGLLDIGNQYGQVTLTKLSSDEWLLVGDLA